MLCKSIYSCVEDNILLHIDTLMHKHTHTKARALALGALELYDSLSNKNKQHNSIHRSAHTYIEFNFRSSSQAI